MCIWPFLCYVHATETTDKHANIRKKFKYSKRCSQCRRRFVELGDNHYVAAHVIAYPCYCMNCCIGVLTLKTTCKYCNAQNRSGKSFINKKSYFSITSILEPFLHPRIKCIIHPFCHHVSVV